MKSQNRSHGSVKSSAPSRTFNSKKSSSKKDDAISKYFSKKGPSEDSVESHSSEEPGLSHKNSLREINNDDITKDFQTPKPIKVMKISQTKKIIKPKSSVKATKFNSKNKTNKNPLFKATKDNFGVFDINGDHLQMALALSKSTYAVEYPELSKDVEDTFPTFLTPDKIPKGSTTLEKFGFKSDRPKLNLEFKRQFTEPPKKKNSKFRFITPTLKTRTVEERESIITTKISIVLCRAKTSEVTEDIEVCEENELYSEELRTCKGKYSLFAINGLSLSGKEKYYNQNLNISPTKSVCGCLLKKWEDIRGRDKSPDRNMPSTPLICLTSEDFEPEVQQSHEQEDNAAAGTTHCNSQSKYLSASCDSKRECISPDLFESESESEYTPKSPDVSDFSQSLLSPSKKQQSSSSSTSFETQRSKLIKEINMLHDFEDYNTGNSLPQMRSLRNECEREAFKVSDDDDDTEKLYSKNKEECVTNLIPEALPKKDNKDSTSLDSHESNLDFKNRPETCFVDLTFSSSSNDSTNHYFPEKNYEKNNFKETVDKVIVKEAYMEDFDTNFEMSPLFLKESCDISANNDNKNGDTTNFLTVKNATNSHNDNRSSKSIGMSFRSDDLDNCSALLNVTDYVNQILNQNDSKIGRDNTIIEQLCNLDQDNSSNKINLEEDKHSLNSNSDNELGLSQESYSLESIVISDEELNYSSVHSCKDTKYDKKFYNLSAIEDIEINQGLMDIDDVDTIHSELRRKYGIKENISSPVHVRISELKGNTTLNRVSLSKEFSEGSTSSEVLENEANEKPSLGDKDADHEYTPEKGSSPATSTKTPENNLIIKTNNITPLADYDTMDTPKITKELEKFGLKPLKRQRGVKLLKYLYESTHPLLLRDGDELSSDEDDKKRVTKKRKKASGIQINNNFNCDHENIEIVGDLLLKNESIDDLIFERKFSKRIASCQVPLQITWHNFLSRNTDIKESILLYEPLQLEVLHTMIKEQTGCKYHIQDLLTFFDRKCITIRTAQGSQKGKRKT